MVFGRDLREKLRPFARLHSPDEHEIFVQGLLSKNHSSSSLICKKDWCDGKSYAILSLSLFLVLCGIEGL